MYDAIVAEIKKVYRLLLHLYELVHRKGPIADASDLLRTIYEFSQSPSTRFPSKDSLFEEFSLQVVKIAMAELSAEVHPATFKFAEKIAAGLVMQDASSIRYRMVVFGMIFLFLFFVMCWPGGGCGVGTGL